MKKTVKLSLIIITIFLHYQMNAQNICIKGGLSLSNLLDKDDDDTYSNDYTMKPGFHIGATVDLPINDFLSFEPGLLYSMKGTKYEEEELNIDYMFKVTTHNVDVPLTAKASYDFGGGLKMFGALGPYVGIGLAGKAKETIEFQGDKESNETDIEWGNDDDSDNLKRLDLGMTFGAGVEINSVLIAISYDLGLANISSYQDQGATIKNRVLRFSVGYLIGN